MSANRVPEGRIERLPSFIRPLAVFARDSLHTVRGKSYCRNAARKEVHRKLTFGVEYVLTNAVKGDIAEFGTMTGVTAAVIARAMAVGPGRAALSQKLHLFDSFIGLPDAQVEADRAAPLVKSGIWARGTCRGISKETLLQICTRYLPKPRIVIYDGWFKDTLPQVAEETRFAMLHVDCDLYQSTMDVLDYTFSKVLVQEGAAIFFDDWNCNRASPNYGERRAWSEIVTKYDVVYSDCGEYGVVGRKFIVHSYRGLATEGSAAP